MRPEYLNDKMFLKLMDHEIHKEQLIKITVLDFKNETAIASIEGKTTSGSCNLSGTSNMRRTGSCSLVVDPMGIEVQGQTQRQQYYNIKDVQNIVSMNKKVKIETGFYNTLATVGYYEDYDIIWYPLGVYVIKAASVTKNTSGLNLSLTLNDKCALINGDMGGTIPAATVFSESENYNSIGTIRTTEKILIKDMIKYLMVEFGGERAENLLIKDIPDAIVKVIKWNGDSDLYYYEQENGGSPQYLLSKLKDASDNEITPTKIFKKGHDIGYMTEPFVYPGTLECNAGEAVSAVLDKIKNVLGNFEWFYDIDGRFVFQQIKNYLNESKVDDIMEIAEQDYLSFLNFNLSTYTLDNNDIVTAISNAPQYNNIKNDYVVWGSKKTGSGAAKPIRYHVAFDSKPPVKNEAYLALVGKGPNGLPKVIMLTENNYKSEIPTDTNELKKSFYYGPTEIQGNNLIYAWDDIREEFRYFNTNEWEICYLIAEDWRTELYFLGLRANNKTFTNNYYAAELNAEWPKICDLKKQTPISQTRNYPTYISGIPENFAVDSCDYWLDFLEGNQGGSQSISQFSISNIGRRSKIVTDNNSNCIIATTFPNFILKEANGKVDLSDIEKDQEVLQLSPSVYKHCTIGGGQNPAYDKIKELLYTHTQFNETVNITTIPIYHLEPNTIINIADNEVGVIGDYLIKSISIPLTVNGTSSISATKCLSKTY